MTRSIRFPAFIAAALAFSAAASSSWAQGARTEDLMRKSGLWEQAAQMRVQMKAGIAEARSQAKASGMALLGDEEFARLSAAIDRTFGVDVIRESMTLQMEERVTPVDQAAVLKWLSSDLGARFTKWEVSAGEMAEINKAVDEAPKIYARLSKARLDKYQRLANALDAGNSTATLTIKLTSAIVYAIALVTPGTDADGAARAIRIRMEGQRDGMVKQFHERSLYTYAYVYRNASDAQMESYVRFAETAAARRYNAAGITAIDESISSAAVALGQELGSSAPQRRNPS